MKVKKQSEKSALRDLHLRKAAKSKRENVICKEESTVRKAVESVQKAFEKKNQETKSIPEPNVEEPRPRRIKSETIHHTGVIYVGHIPHGFYEDQMKEFFTQFGTVKRVRVARSRKNGNSRGYGYVEFEYPEVAKIAAESMNNYLMCGRLLKTEFIPPEKHHIGFFLGKPWSKQRYPRLNNLYKETRLRNAKLNKRGYKRFVNKTKAKLSALERKLQENGINLKFVPADAPKT